MLFTTHTVSEIAKAALYVASTYRHSTVLDCHHLLRIFLSHFTLSFLSFNHAVIIRKMNLTVPQWFGFSLLGFIHVHPLGGGRNYLIFENDAAAEYS